MAFLNYKEKIYKSKKVFFDVTVIFLFWNRAKNHKPLTVLTKKTQKTKHHYREHRVISTTDT